MVNCSSCYGYSERYSYRSYRRQTFNENCLCCRLTCIAIWWSLWVGIGLQMEYLFIYLTWLHKTYACNKAWFAFYDYSWCITLGEVYTTCAEIACRGVLAYFLWLETERKRSAGGSGNGIYFCTRRASFPT